MSVTDLNPLAVLMWISAGRILMTRNSHQNLEETTMSDQAIEKDIQAKGLNAPRVSLDDLNSNIVHAEIVKHVSPSDQVLRWAVITTRNGFSLAGRPSCAASSANDNQELGEKIAIDNARNELWPLMGYALREQLSKGGGHDCQRASKGEIMSNSIKDAMDTLALAMQADPEYAWGWHCNIAMAAYDGGSPHNVANEGAARFMRLCFGVDTSKHPGFHAEQVAEDEQARSNHGHP